MAGRATSRTLIVVVLLASLLGACTVVRIGEEDSESGDQYAAWTKTGTGFDAVEYVEAVWDEQLIPMYEESAVDLTMLLQELRADRDAAIEQYGLVRDAGEPSAVFKVRGTATVLEFDDTSRNGLFRIDLPPYDSVADLPMQVGPVIRGQAIRDSAEFIRFTEVGNQLQFAALANELNARMVKDSVEPLDLENAAGLEIGFLGAFKITEGDSLDDIVITPVRISPVDGEGG